MIFEDFTNYTELIMQLWKYEKEIAIKKPAIAEVDKKMRMKERLKWIIPTATTILGVILTYILTKFFLT